MTATALYEIEGCGCGWDDTMVWASATEPGAVPITPTTAAAVRRPRRARDLGSLTPG